MKYTIKIRTRPANRVSAGYALAEYQVDASDIMDAATKSLDLVRLLGADGSAAEVAEISLPIDGGPRLATETEYFRDWGRWELGATGDTIDQGDGFMAERLEWAAEDGTELECWIERGDDGDDWAYIGPRPKT